MLLKILPFIDQLNWISTLAYGGLHTQHCETLHEVNIGITCLMKLQIKCILVVLKMVDSCTAFVSYLVSSAFYPFLPVLMLEIVSFVA